MDSLQSVNARKTADTNSGSDNATSLRETVGADGNGFGLNTSPY